MTTHFRLNVHVPSRNFGVARFPPQHRSKPAPKPPVKISHSSPPPMPAPLAPSLQEEFYRLLEGKHAEGSIFVYKDNKWVIDSIENLRSSFPS